MLLLFVFLYQTFGLGITKFLGFLQILDAFFLLPVQTLAQSQEKITVAVFRKVGIT